jgi:menaquinone-dependent protoporphyrinogen oxidase
MAESRPFTNRKAATMKVLVTVATRHGSTWMIGEALREELVATGLQAHLLEPELLRDISDYDAVVIGSAVYSGRWLKPARKFVQRFEAQLAGKPVWLFSSGPIGDPARPTAPPAEALDIALRVRARDHQVFEGRLERDILSVGERAVTRLMGAQSGDHRPWVAVTIWARQIAASLKRELEPALVASAAARS